MLDARDLYLRNIATLKSILSNPDQYDYLRAAAILRQLLLDDTRLTDVVNRDLRIKIRYVACDVTRDPDLAQDLQSETMMIFSVQDGLYPHDSHNGKYIDSFSRDQFLGLLVGVLNGQRITVRDIISYAANKLGGVHYDEHAENKEALLREACNRTNIDGMSVHVRQLASITRVVLDALRELTEAIERSRS